MVIEFLLTSSNFIGACYQCILENDLVIKQNMVRNYLGGRLQQNAQKQRLRNLKPGTSVLAQILGLDTSRPRAVVVPPPGHGATAPQRPARAVRFTLGDGRIVLPGDEDDADDAEGGPEDEDTTHADTGSWWNPMRYFGSAYRTPELVE